MEDVVIVSGTRALPFHPAPQLAVTPQRRLRFYDHRAGGRLEPRPPAGVEYAVCRRRKPLVPHFRLFTRLHFAEVFTAHGRQIAARQAGPAPLPLKPSLHRQSLCDNQRVARALFSHPPRFLPRC
ncbi:unnamed protein product, partial [Mesocestoides corti]